ncbi:MBOAT family O-acyltransferase [Merdibacter massiliensis]|uniref:MBOAT family O-acyltransferase n=1 Tax=Merdibacter massiliensis TaxID=1871030 RepID=UPI00096A9ECF|nr:MBOAT family O-acyltransferase [Merdibacter massiliensis]
MAFNTITFITFFLVVFIGYSVFPKRYKWVFLLCASYFFYLYASVKFLIFILITTLSSWIGALWIEKYHQYEKMLSKEKEGNPKVIKLKKEQIKKYKKRILISVLILNFGILVFLKYFNFFAENMNALFEQLTLGSQVPTLNLILPLGISFYTFQTMSYLIDVYWGKTQAEKNLGKLALFVSFFPQIIEGPIGRYNDLAPQLFSEKKSSAFQIRRGIQLMLWGYFKKMVIADRVAIIADYVFENYAHISGVGVAVGIFLYAIQDYTDFSGCIDIARGCARTMGINMAENFRRPYFSRTIPEFWRRWHMSLGAWMKDYVFYPFSLTKGVRNLGKKAKVRFGKSFGRTLPIALGNLLVFFLVGVWHGANWNYIIWGLFYGVLIAVSGMMKPVFEAMNKKLHISVQSKGFQLFQILRTFIITCIGCVIFRSITVQDSLYMIYKVFNDFNINIQIKKELLSFGLDKWNWIVLVMSLIVLFGVDLLQEYTSVGDWIDCRIGIVRWTIYFAVCISIILFGMYGAGLNPTQFVYMQF